MYRGHIGSTSSKLITQIISLGSSLIGATTSVYSQRGTPTPLKFGWNRGGVVLSRKPAISLKRGKTVVANKVTIDDQQEVACALSIGAKINDLG